MASVMQLHGGGRKNRKKRRKRKKTRRRKIKRRKKKTRRRRRRKKGGNDFDDCKKYPTQGEILECRNKGGVKAYRRSKQKKHLFHLPKFKSLKTRKLLRDQKKEQDLIDSMEW